MHRSTREDLSLGGIQLKVIHDETSSTDTDRQTLLECHADCSTHTSGCRVHRHVDENDDEGSAAADQQYTAATELVQGLKPVEVPPTTTNRSLMHCVRPLFNQLPSHQDRIITATSCEMAAKGCRQVKLH